MLYRSICRQIKTKIKDRGMCNLHMFLFKGWVFFFLFIEIHLFVSRSKINNFVGLSCNTKSSTQKFYKDYGQNMDMLHGCV